MHTRTNVQSYIHTRAHIYMYICMHIHATNRIHVDAYIYAFLYVHRYLQLPVIYMGKVCEARFPNLGY